MVPHLCRALVAPLVGLVGEPVLVLLHHLALTYIHVIIKVPKNPVHIL